MFATSVNVISMSYHHYPHLGVRPNHLSGVPSALNTSPLRRLRVIKSHGWFHILKMVQHINHQPSSISTGDVHSAPSRLQGAQGGQGRRACGAADDQLVIGQAIQCQGNIREE